MTNSLRARLSLMMLLQYFMFGAWLVPLGTYLSKGLRFDDIIGTAFGMQGIAAIVSTLAVGAIADRFINAERLMGLLFVGAGVTLLLLTQVQYSKVIFLAVLFFHFLFFVPTIPLANAVALNALSNPATQFPSIRVMGTLGWIASGLTIGLISSASTTRLPLILGGAAGLLLAAYSFSLPSTPPRARGEVLRPSALLGLDLLRQVRSRNVWIFLLCETLTIIPLAFYNAYCNTFLTEAGAVTHIFGFELESSALQALGQASEFIFLLLLPLMLLKFRIKGVLMMGMLSWTVRYLLFSYGFAEGQLHTGLLIAGILLHGVAYDFFFVASQLYVDQCFAATARARAQSLLVTLNMGVGVVLGSNFANWVYDMNTVSVSTHRWQQIWLVPAVIALGVGSLFGVFFRGDTDDTPLPESRKMPRAT